MKRLEFGRFTWCGGVGVEHEIQDLVSRAARAILKFVPRGSLKALALAGGYGRGEGGVRRDVLGAERPANNLDFLLFTTGLDATARLRLSDAVNAELNLLRRRSGMGLDFSVVDARRVSRDKVRVLWYDVRHGHKLLAGDENFLPGLRRFVVENIDAREMADLMVNRGALLVLNDLILARGALTPASREAVLTHAAKAVIGFGDALLFFSGRYHWSYVERRRRMAANPIGTSSEFRELYEEAMAYRFTGDVAIAARLVRQTENGYLRKTLAAQYLEIEKMRLGAPIAFQDHVRASLSRELRESASSLRGLARGAFKLVRGSGRRVSAAPYAVRLGLRAGGDAAAVRALFPMAAFGRLDADEKPLAVQILGVARPVSNEGRLAWLRLWGRVFDSNLVFTLKRLELVRDGAMAA